MRGARENATHISVHMRIIPADAGSTLTTFSAHSYVKDHPRGCGEHVFHSFPFYSLQGSSPRMRGAPGVTPRAA